MNKELLQQALDEAKADAIYVFTYAEGISAASKDAIEYMHSWLTVYFEKQALAQQEHPAQEPVGKFLKATYGDYAVLNWRPSYVAKIGDCLYARPAPTQPALSDDEIWQFWCNRPEVPEGEDDSMEAEFVAACKRAIEAHCRGGAWK